MAARSRAFGLVAILAPLSICVGIGCAQTTPDLARIMERLDRLERENRELAEQVRDLRTQLGTPAPPPPTVAEKVEINEHRIEEMAQTKVEASQKFAIRFTGMALFNAFANSRQSGFGLDYPVVAGPTGSAHSGATVRQTILGLEFGGPNAIWGGKVSGSVYMDFYGGPEWQMHVRTAHVEVAWKDRSVMAGLEKPIFNPREPSSLAQVGISPLTGAGNLWLWLPQVRAEQDFRWGSSSGLRAQVGAVQTREIGPYNTGTVVAEASRPGLAGR